MLAYPIELTEDDNNTFLVTCPDLPEVTTFGSDVPECLANARGAIAEAVAARLSAFQDIPKPSPGDLCAILPLQMELKVSLFHQLADSDRSRADLVRALSWHRPQVDRLFDPNHATRLDQYEAAFAALGQRAEFSVRPISV